MSTTVRCVCVLVSLVAFVMPGNAAPAGGLMIGRFEGEPLTVEKGDHSPQDEWYQSLQIVARNVSDRPIYFAMFDLELPGAELAGQTMVMHLCYGRESLAKGGKPDSDDKPIAPSKTVKIRIMEDAGCAQVGLMKRTRPQYGGNAVLRLRIATFGDGSRWHDGRIVKG